MITHRKFSIIFLICYEFVIELKYDNCWPLVVYFMARDTHYTDMQTNTFVDLNIYVCEIRRLAKSFAAS